MNNFINDKFGVTEYKGKPITNSRNIAEIFTKRHEKVIRDIEELCKKLPPNFGEMFIVTNYKDTYGRKQPSYVMDRDGFTLLAMGFTGEKAIRFKLEYISRFNQMESFIKSLSAAKLEFPEFTQAILVAHDEPKHYHFSNEINMINRIVLGVDARGFKLANGIDPEVQSIRPYLSLSQIRAIEILQKIDTGLIITEPNFERRKQILSNYYHRLNSIQLLSA